MNINEIDIESQKKQIEQIQSSAASENVTQVEVKPRQVNAEKITYEETNEIVKSLENYMNVLQTNIGFSINTDLEKVIVTVTNKETDEVIRQIPPKELVALQEKMKELTGIIFSETA